MWQLQQAEKSTAQLRMRMMPLQLPERGVMIPVCRADGAFSEPEFSGQSEAAGGTDAHSRKIAFDLLEVLLHPGGLGFLALFWAERPPHRPKQRAGAQNDREQENWDLDVARLLGFIQSQPRSDKDVSTVNGESPQGSEFVHPSRHFWL